MIVYLATIIATTLIYMTVWYGISQIARRSDVADIAWGLGFAVIAWAAYIMGSPDEVPALIVNVLVTIWGVRLAIHVYQRNRGKPEDRRYVEMREKWGHDGAWRTYVHVFLSQGLLMLLVTAPILVANYTHADEVIFTPWQALGVLVWLIGFFFEAVGDWQLGVFIRNPRNKGHLMTKGLWRYTRHPNYFGEVVQWWGIFLLALTGLPALIAVVGPITISYLILKVSGVPMLERKMKDNPEFAEYADRTSIFFPRPPRS